MKYIGELNPGEYYFSNDAGEECYAVVQDGKVGIETYDGELTPDEFLDIMEQLKIIVGSLN
jgi:hypothetical protein